MCTAYSYQILSVESGPQIIILDKPINFTYRIVRIFWILAYCNSVIWSFFECSTQLECGFGLEKLSQDQVFVNTLLQIQSKICIHTPKIISSIVPHFGISLQMCVLMALHGEKGFLAYLFFYVILMSSSYLIPGKNSPSFLDLSFESKMVQKL